MKIKKFLRIFLIAISIVLIGIAMAGCGKEQAKEVKFQFVLKETDWKLFYASPEISGQDYHVETKEFKFKYDGKEHIITAHTNRDGVKLDSLEHPLTPAQFNIETGEAVSGGLRERGKYRLTYSGMRLYDSSGKPVMPQLDIFIEIV